MGLIQPWASWERGTGVLEAEEAEFGAMWLGLEDERKSGVQEDWNSEIGFYPHTTPPNASRKNPNCPHPDFRQAGLWSSPAVTHWRRLHMWWCFTTTLGNGFNSALLSGKSELPCRTFRGLMFSFTTPARWIFILFLKWFLFRRHNKLVYVWSARWWFNTCIQCAVISQSNQYLHHLARQSFLRVWSFSMSLLAPYKALLPLML